MRAHSLMGSFGLGQYIVGRFLGVRLGARIGSVFAGIRTVVDGFRGRQHSPIHHLRAGFWCRLLQRLYFPVGTRVVLSRDQG